MSTSDAEIDVLRGPATIPNFAAMRPGQAIATHGLKVYTPPTQRIFGYRAASADIAAVERELKDRRWDFRRPASIAAATGLPLDEVMRILTSSGVARRPYGRPGTDLFTHADQPVSLRERLSLLDTFIAKRP